MSEATSDFVSQLLQVSQQILEASQRGEWEQVNALTAEREQMIASEAGQQPPVAGSEPQWREVDRLNREALALAQAQLEQLGQGVQSTVNQQRLQERYGR